MNELPPVPTATEREAEQRAEVIALSLRAHTYAWLGWLPVVGIVFALNALSLARQAKREEAARWNPARNYRRAALGMAVVECFVWFVCDGALLVGILKGLAEK